MTLSVSISFFATIKSQKNIKPLVHHYVTMGENDYDNGYPEWKYHEVLDKFIEVYEPIIVAKGGTFHIQRDWYDGAVNAWAWRIGQEYHLEVPGGMSRYHLINEEAFVMVICHELGHILGGAPASKYEISYEGQSDYFAASHCIKRMLPEIKAYKNLTPDNESTQLCQNNQQCHRALLGAKSLANYFAFLDGTKNLSLLNESKSVVKKTKKDHPSSQCRLDTMKRGYLCPVTPQDSVSYQDDKLGSCHSSFHFEFARPQCWYLQN